VNAVVNVTGLLVAEPLLTSAPPPPPRMRVQTGYAAAYQFIMRYRLANDGH